MINKLSCRCQEQLGQANYTIPYFLQVITLQVIMPFKDSGLDTQDYIVAVVTTITTPSNDFPYTLMLVRIQYHVIIISPTHYY